MLRKFVIVSAIAALSPIAAADSFSDSHDDSTIQVESHWLERASELDIDRILDSDSRIIDLDVTNTSPLEFNVVTVENTGPYAVPVYWVYHGQTFAQIGQRINDHDGRIIDIEPYVVGNSFRYAFIMVPDSGETDANWWWQVGQTFAEIVQYADDHNARIVDIESEVLGGTRYWSALYLENSGPDATAWWYISNVSWGAINDFREANNARFLDFEDRGNGNYTAILVPRGPRALSWWSTTREGLVRVKAVERSERLVDVERFIDGSGNVRYLASLVENSDQAPTCAGDTNGDGVVDIDDLLNVLAAFGMCP